MILKQVELGCAVTFIKYPTSVVSLIFQPKILILNKTKFLESSLLQLVELVVKEIKNTISENIYQYSFL